MESVKNVASRSLRGAPVDSVWKFLSDGRWHTLGELATRLELNREEIREIAHFLVRYGFGETTVFRQESFRLSGYGPSPKVVAWILRGLRHLEARGLRPASCGHYS
jgi:hypothetical protein